MKQLLKKIKSKNGFTLMEMLIVVAIIVILVAVSVPVFSSQLNKAKQATDDANFRSAKSAAVAAYYLKDDSSKVDFTKDCYYDADKGEISNDTPKKDYGQCDKNKYVKVTFGTDGTVECTWVTSGSGS